MNKVDKIDSLARVARAAPYSPCTEKSKSSYIGGEKGIALSTLSTLSTQTTTKTIQHPNLPWSITFDTAAHTYTDNESRAYTSVTTLIHAQFPAFDASTAAARVAAREGRLEMEVLTEWNRKRDASAKFGTNVHAFAEATISRLPLPAPATDAERRAFAIVAQAIDMLASSYEFISAEQIIFDPLFQIAGTIDLIARNRQTGALAVIDWKTCEEITDQAYGRGLPPIQHINDSKLNHYALQLSMYALLYADPDYTAYTSESQPVELALVHILPASADPVWIPLPYMRAACVAILDSRKTVGTPPAGGGKPLPSATCQKLTH